MLTGIFRVVDRRQRLDQLRLELERLERVRFDRVVRRLGGRGRRLCRRDRVGRLHASRCHLGGRRQDRFRCRGVDRDRRFRVGRVGGCVEVEDTHVSLCRDCLVTVVDRCAQRVPGQGGALDPGRIVTHACKDGQLAERGIIDRSGLVAYEPTKPIEQRPRLVERLPLDALSPSARQRPGKWRSPNPGTAHRSPPHRRP